MKADATGRAWVLSYPVAVSDAARAVLWGGEDRPAATLRAGDGAVRSKPAAGRATRQRTANAASCRATVRSHTLVTPRAPQG
jgi:hypothetical protein